jgi:hypothetical protein
MTYVERTAPLSPVCPIVRAWREGLVGPDPELRLHRLPIQRPRCIRRRGPLEGRAAGGAEGADQVCHWQVGMAGRALRRLLPGDGCRLERRPHLRRGRLGGSPVLFGPAGPGARRLQAAREGQGVLRSRCSCALPPPWTGGPASAGISPTPWRPVPPVRRAWRQNTPSRAAVRSGRAAPTAASASGSTTAGRQPVDDAGDTGSRTIPMHKLPSHRRWQVGRAPVASRHQCANWGAGSFGLCPDCDSKCSTALARSASNISARSRLKPSRTTIRSTARSWTLGGIV